MTEWTEGEVYANGINIHYYRSDGSNKPSILLLHGFTDNGCAGRVWLTNWKAAMISS
jgi:pimeloyl-ACP methyl ester carboxylesterase